MPYDNEFTWKTLDENPWKLIMMDFYKSWFKLEHCTTLFKISSMLYYCVKVYDLNQAKMIAIKFLEQYNSSVTFRSATLEGEIWMVILDIGMMNKQTRKVLIDGTTGNILSYTSKN